ncbi:MAG: hypothetical protein QOE53_3268 [Pseudonocardiales bacterium]|nr:hypothetical protein [Pseudonocardiales bacterium]
MRKFLIAAIAALASIALASVAVAANSDVSATTTISPKKAGTKSKPKAVKITTFVRNNVPGSTASKIDILFPKNVKISGKGLTSCKYSTFSTPGGQANCPKGSKAGSGVSHATLGRSGQPQAPLNFDVTAYVSTPKLLVFYLQQQGGSVQKALKGTISSASGKFKQKLTIVIPPDLQQPVPGLYGALSDLKSTLYNKKGKHSLISTIGCSKKKDVFGAKLTFAPNDKPAPKPSASGTSTAKCSS